MGQRIKPRQQDRKPRKATRDMIPNDRGFSLGKRDKRNKRERSWEQDISEDFDR